MRYFIVCGEISGDLYGARLMAFLKQKDPLAEFEFTGGEKMEQTAGKRSLIPLSQLNFMGFMEVIKNISYVFKNFRIIKQHILTYQPHHLILIDYPGFNLRIAKWYHLKTGNKAHYFISPTVWAWRPKRALYIKNYCEKLYCILPFEKNFYEKLGITNIEFVGHPMVEEINEFKKNSASVIFDGSNKRRPKVLLMPGSRIQELKKHLPLMIKLTKRFPDVSFILSAMKNIPFEYYKPAASAGIKLSYENSLSLMSIADAAVIKSGTSSLQATLMKLPHMVVYKSNPISVFIAKKLVKLKYISLVNIILDKKIVQEFIQNDYNLPNLEKELRKMLSNPSYTQCMKLDFESITGILSPFNVHPCEKVAELIIGRNIMIRK